MADEQVLGDASLDAASAEVTTANSSPTDPPSKAARAPKGGLTMAYARPAHQRALLARLQAWDREIGGLPARLPVADGIRLMQAVRASYQRGTLAPATAAWLRERGADERWLSPHRAARADAFSICARFVALRSRLPHQDESLEGIKAGRWLQSLRRAARHSDSEAQRLLASLEAMVASPGAARGYGEETA